MPIVRTKWSDIPPEDLWDYQDEESFNMFWDSIEEEAKRVRESSTPEEFQQWLEETGTKWVDD